ncbi:hypothetical protein LNKW23_06300 [Paralimibaculum aggregatum]|uniref:DUF488 domain-containing protein n=1 Tax=Paralimibaculum aggregatum TaxID=3036245 RepID=A0ABQ6LEL0_9RHOB|nr:DUF488 domain-containing protein [Limibaculum sp. NKW23]GMG81417.1 hypothetical protein LNKW23_06300 [Limibaculum sp. NKW23]
MIATIGYAKATQDALIARLQGAGIGRLVDVRAVAASRRAGFSKRVLAASLGEAGIDYVHLRGLGTPKPGRDAARKGRVDEMRAIFAAHLETPEAQDDWARLLALVEEGPLALLCYCEHAAGCHRRVLSERLEAETGRGWTDL